MHESAIKKRNIFVKSPSSNTVSNPKFKNILTQTIIFISDCCFKRAYMVTQTNVFDECDNFINNADKVICVFCRGMNLDYDTCFNKFTFKNKNCLRRELRRRRLKVRLFTADSQCTSDICNHNQKVVSFNILSGFCTIKTLELSES